MPTTTTQRATKTTQNCDPFSSADESTKLKLAHNCATYGSTWNITCPLNSYNPPHISLYYYLFVFSNL